MEGVLLGPVQAVAEPEVRRKGEEGARRRAAPSLNPRGGRRPPGGDPGTGERAAHLRHGLSSARRSGARRGPHRAPEPVLASRLRGRRRAPGGCRPRAGPSGARARAPSLPGRGRGRPRGGSARDGRAVAGHAGAGRRGGRAGGQAPAGPGGRTRAHPGRGGLVSKRSGAPAREGRGPRSPGLEPRGAGRLRPEEAPRGLPHRRPARRPARRGRQVRPLDGPGPPR